MIAALISNGIKPGNKVLVPTYTFIATVNSVLAIGAIPFLVDCEPDTFNVSGDTIERAFDQNKDACCVMFVDVAGLPADIDFFFLARGPLRRGTVIYSNTKAYALDSPVLNDFLDKIHVIHQGVNMHLYDYMENARANQIRSTFLQGNYKFIVSFIGRLVPYKGIPFLLDAIKIINSTTDLKIHFVIGGNGPQRLSLIEQANQLGLRNVSFIGHVDDKDLFNLPWP